MQVRKDRAHFYGATNLDFRSVDSLPIVKLSSTPKISHLDLLCIPKKNIDEILKSKYYKKMAHKSDAFTETYSFYKEKGKPTQEFIKISKPRDHQLDKTGQIPFIGDSNLVYDERLFSNYNYNSYKNNFFI